MNITEVESGGDKGGVSNGDTPSPQKTRLTLSDALFLVFLCLVIQAVFMVGRFAHDEATKTEVSKTNGEAWVKWFAENSPTRFEAGFKPEACAGLVPLQSEMLDGKPEAEVAVSNAALENKANSDNNAGPGSKTATESNAASEITAASDIKQAPDNKATAGKPAKSSRKTWGGCMDALKSAKVSVAEQINPFSLKPVAFVAKCDPADHSLNGAIVLEKLTPTPPGSSVPSTASELLVSDGIASKLQLRVTICDKGSYPIRIAEIEF